MSEIIVGMGEVRVTTPPATLAIRGLGSCVAVILYDHTTQVAGLAHVVLPAGIKTQGSAPTRSAPAAIESLLEQMQSHGARRSMLVAYMVGGARMLRTTGGPSIGQRNVAAVRTLLQQEGIPIRTEDTGGRRARSLVFEVSSGEMKVRRLPILLGSRLVRESEGRD
ncbi:MAG: chemotaxis protein CheD [Chloroflexota bacterium]|nr:chemotaxis protein CheD [Chloroflexota bacterium]